MIRFICISIAILVLVVPSANAQRDEPQLLDEQAKYFLSKGMLDSAVQKLIQRAMYFKAKNQSAEYISSFVEIADLYVQKEDYLKSRSYLNRIDPDSINFDNSEVRTSLIEWYLYQGYVSEKVGDYLSAKTYYESVHLRLMRKEDEQALELGRYLYQPLGNIYTRLGEHGKAILFLEKFRELSLVSRDQNAMAEAHNDLGIVYQSLGENQKAISVYEEALKIPALSNSSKGLILSNLGSSLLSIGNNTRALTCARQALEFFAVVDEQELTDQNKHAYQAWTYGVIAKVYYGQGNYKMALQNIDQALKFTERSLGNSISREVAKLYVLKGSTLLKSQQTNEALQNFQLALTFLFNTYKETDPESNPDDSIIFAENTIIEALQGKAEAYYQHYLASNDRSLLAKALNSYLLIFKVEDRIAEEYDFDRSKLLLLGERNERSRKAMDISYALYESTRHDKYIEIAFEIMERNKARVLLESQSEVRAKKSLQISKTLLEKEREYRQSVAYLQKLLVMGQNDGRKDSIAKENLFRVQKDLATINQQLASEYPGYFRLVAQQMKLMSAAQVQDALIQRDQALIEFFFGNDFLYAIKIEKEKITFTRIKTNDDFFLKTQRYLDLLRKPSMIPNESSKMYQMSFEIYEQIFKPVINDQFTKTCIIIPDGVLVYLPFETLVTRQLSPSENVRFLLSETATSYSFSASALYQSMLLNDMSSSKKSFLGFAPGFINSKVFQPLNYSREEVDKIAGLVDGLAYKDEVALKKTFIDESPQYQILHLSTHAAVEKNSSLDSWVAFHDGVTQQEDSFKLFLSEIYNLQLQADLVVLSACETGTGYLSQGEGVMSLARGFAFAGCASTLMTLWQVSDNATSRINQSFYNYLLKGWYKNDALRQAKLDYLQSDDIDKVGKHPYFWSSLVVMGDTRPVELRRHNNLIWLGATAIAGLMALLLAIKKRRKNNSAS